MKHRCCKIEIANLQLRFGIFTCKLEGLSVERMYLRQRCFDGSLNETIVKPRDQYVYVGFSGRKIPHSMAYTIVEKAIRFRHPDYNPDRAQNLIGLSMSQHLLTHNISSKSMHAFLSNLANRQTDERGQTHLPPPLLDVISVVVSIAL